MSWLQPYLTLNILLATGAIGCWLVFSLNRKYHLVSTTFELQMNEILFISVLFFVAPKLICVFAILFLKSSITEK